MDIAYKGAKCAFIIVSMAIWTGCTETSPNLVVQLTAPGDRDGGRSANPWGGIGSSGEAKEGGQGDCGIERAESVFVTVASVSVHSNSTSGTSWWTVSDIPQTVDLLELPGAVRAIGFGSLPEGSYGQTRLEIVSSTIVIDGVSHEVTVPSGDSSGLKIPTDFDIRPDVETVLTLSFDPVESMSCNNGNGYMMDPVVDMISVIYIDPDVPEAPTYGDYTFPPLPGGHGDPTPTAAVTPTEGMPHNTPVVVPVYPYTPTQVPDFTEEPTFTAPPTPTDHEPTVTAAWPYDSESPSPSEPWWYESPSPSEPWWHESPSPSPSEPWWYESPSPSEPWWHESPSPSPSEPWWHESPSPSPSEPWWYYESPSPTPSASPTLPEYVDGCHGDVNACSINFADWMIFQDNPFVTRYFASPSMMPFGSYLIMARSATRSEFEAHWGHTLPPEVLFHSSGVFPQINGGESFGLLDREGDVVDGPTVAMTAGVSLTRVAANAGDPGSWSASAVSGATPGWSHFEGPGIYFSEITDAGDGENDRFDYVELYIGGGSSLSQ